MKTRFTTSGNARIAYQVVGEGPLDLLFVPGFASHVELQWADPSYARFLNRLASFSRLIVFDKRGAGMSSAVDAPPTLEQRVADLRAVLDAVASDRAVVLGFSEGGAGAAVFAATNPRRCTGLILCASIASGADDDDGAIARMEERLAPVIEHWGEGRGLELFAPSLAGSALVRRNFGLFERAALRPDMARAIAESVRQIDVTHVLPAIRVPTLVLHRRGDFVPFERGRDMAARIPGARFVELQGSDHVPYAGDPGPLLRAIEDFVGELIGRAAPPPSFGTILFTDIVGSTERLVDLGDAAWTELIGSHDALAAAEVEHCGGRVVKRTGDGLLALFDSPNAGIRAAWAIREQVRRLGVEVRAGLHAGECSHAEGDVTGLAVHAAARVMAAAAAGEILVSNAVRDLVGDSSVPLAPRGAVELKGLPDAWELHSLAGDPPPYDEPPAGAERTRLSFGDRIQVGFARRAPAAARSMARLTG